MFSLSHCVVFEKMNVYLSTRLLVVVKVMYILFYVFQRALDDISHALDQLKSRSAASKVEACAIHIYIFDYYCFLYG